MADATLNMLLVEDTPDTRKLIKTALDDPLVVIDEAVNGQEGLQLFRSKSYDLVLTDVQMPILDGVNATKMMRRHERQQAADKRVPIIGLTAGGRFADKEDCLQAGMDAFLTKPIDFAELIGKIEELTGRKITSSHCKYTAESSESYDAIFDVNRAIQRLQGNTKLFEELMKFFDEDHGALLTSIEVGVSSNDVDLIVQGAHALKGMAAGIGGDAVVAKALELEEKASASASTRDLQRCFDDLESCVKKLRKHLDNWLLRQRKRGHSK